MIGRVLVVDDDDQIRRALSTSLLRAGFEVTSVDDGLPAIELSDMPLDVVVVDFNLKTMTGLDVVKHFKAQYGQKICCIILSGEDSESTRDRCIDAGADDVIQKPASPRALRERLNEAVAELRRAA